jgi:thymidylate kinase
MTSSHPCSEETALPTPRHGLIVLEGMPGAGKTTTGTALGDLGLAVVGEYTSAAAATIAISEHPPVDDDDAHQANWTRKAAQCTALLAAGQTVYADRDWLSSLSHAYSTAPADDGALLARRARWVLAGLRESRLLLPGLYVIFDLDPAASLHRRAGRLRPGHPWNDPQALQRLRDFYTDPAGAIAPHCTVLADALLLPARRDISGHDHIERAASLLTALAGQA